MEWILQHLDIDHLVTQVVAFAPRLGAAALIFVAFVVGFRITRSALAKALVSMHLHKKLVELLVNNVYRYVLLIVGLVMALDQVGVNMGAAFAGIGAAGIAIGFAAQDTLSNLISGFMIFMDKPFVVGDWIEVAGERGEVRVDVPIGIAYKEDVSQARQVLLSAIEDIDSIKSSPEPDVVVGELADSSVNLRVRVWVSEAGDVWPTRFSVLESGKKALDEAGIQIPFPHLQLFVDDVAERVWEDARKLPGSTQAA